MPGLPPADCNAYGLHFVRCRFLFQRGSNRSFPFSLLSAPLRDISEPVVTLAFSCKPFAAFLFPADRPLTHKSLPAAALVISRLLRCERLRYCCSSPLQTQADVTTLVTDHSFASSSYAHISVHEKNYTMPKAQALGRDVLCTSSLTSGEALRSSASHRHLQVLVPGSLGVFARSLASRSASL